MLESRRDIITKLENRYSINTYFSSRQLKLLILC